MMTSWLCVSLPLVVAIIICSVGTHGETPLLRKEKPQEEKPRLGSFEGVHPDFIQEPLSQKDEKIEQAPPVRQAPVYEYIGQPRDDNFPEKGLGPCQADCNSDSHCQEGLLCMLRDGDEPVPGCVLGKAVFSKDYCYDPSTPSPTVSPEPSAAPSGNEPTSSPVPSRSPTPGPTTGSPTLSPTTSPTTTAAPTGSPSLAPSRNDLFLFGDDDDGPFRKCEGPCGNDDDCKGNLKCQRRTAFEPVTGCDGGGKQGENYCYDPSDGPAVPQLPAGSFRLKLYWESEYFWQESYDHQKWCLQNEGRLAPPVVRSCRGSSTKWEFIYEPGYGDMIKVGGANLCLEKTGVNNVTLQTCDRDEPDQKWLGNWISRRFDIRPLRKEGCLTQHHHPRSGERVYVQGCRVAHMTNTGYWNIDR